MTIVTGHEAHHSPILAPSPPGSRPQLYRRTRLVGVVAVAAVVVAAVVVPVRLTAAAVPVAVGGILLGIPHGAVDHVVPGWLAGRALPRRAMVVLLAGYVLVLVVAAAALRAAPVVALAVFLALSVWHFGRGEVAAAAEDAGRPLPGTTQDLLPTLAHGLVTVVLPLAARPDVARPVLTALAPGLPVLSGGARPAVLAAVLLVVALTAARLVRGGRSGEAGELVLLTLLFGLVHPFVAFGVYFGAWHALRHTARLVDLAAGDDAVPAGVRRVARQAALPTALALAYLAGVWATARSAGPSSLLTAELATLAALTFPHAGIVAALDQGRRTRRPGRLA